MSVCWVAKFWKKFVTRNVSDDKDKDQKRNLMDLEHKSQSTASRCERRGEDERERGNKRVVVQDIPPENDPQ